MNPLIAFFNTILYQPLFNILILLYLYLPGSDFGLAVIVLTLLIRVLLSPLTAQAIKSQQKIALLQPKLDEIKEKYKDDRVKQSQAMLEVYRQAKINPFASLVPLLIQLPLLIALFLVLKRSVSGQAMDFLYGPVPNPGQINFVFLGLFNLAEGSLFLALLAGLSQFLQSKITMKQQGGKETTQKKGADFSGMLQKQMLYFFPVLTVLIVWRLPSAIALYWITSSLFSMGEQYFINVKNQKSGIVKLH